MFVLLFVSCYKVEFFVCVMFEHWSAPTKPVHSYRYNKLKRIFCYKFAWWLRVCCIKYCTIFICNVSVHKVVIGSSICCEKSMMEYFSNKMGHHYYDYPFTSWSADNCRAISSSSPVDLSDEIKFKNPKSLFCKFEINFDVGS